MIALQFLFNILSSERLSIVEEALQYVTADNDSDYSDSSDEEFTSFSSSEEFKSNETETWKELNDKKAETEEKEVLKPRKWCWTCAGKRSGIVTRDQKKNRAARSSKKDETSAKVNLLENTWLKSDILPNVPEFNFEPGVKLELLRTRSLCSECVEIFYNWWNE